MADADSTGTLVVVALSGGAGALLGAILGQAVQLHRDKRQYEREDARHERERLQALEDARTTRREERYIALLTVLGHLRSQLQAGYDWIDLWLLVRERLDDPSEEDSDLEAEYPALVEEIKAFADGLEPKQSEVSTAVATAYPVASSSVREKGLEVSRLRLIKWHDLASPDLDTAVRETSVIASYMSKPARRAKWARQELDSAVGLCDELDEIVRRELRLT